ncbi:hypothetical protein STENM223S_09184 [Streptomyces tendae]
MLGAGRQPAVLSGGGRTWTPGATFSQYKASKVPCWTGTERSAAAVWKGVAKPGRSSVSWAKAPPASMPCREHWRTGRSSSIRSNSVWLSGTRDDSIGAHSGCSATG